MGFLNIDEGFLQLVVDVVKHAGAIIETIASEGYETKYKEGTDPVTTADLAANDFLRQRLMAVLPEAGWLSEETKDSDERLLKRYVWIVDPIDGTKEFVERVPEYAVSVALSYEGHALLGVVYNPAKDECYAGLVGVGAWLNGDSVSAVFLSEGKLKVLGSRSEIKRGEFEHFMQLVEVEAVGSIAYKLALVASGRANATWSLGPKNEWDIAAGVALINAAGGKVADPEGRDFIFNRKNTLVDGVIAATEKDFMQVIEMIRMTH